MRVGPQLSYMHCDTSLLFSFMLVYAVPDVYDVPVKPGYSSGVPPPTSPYFCPVKRSAYAYSAHSSTFSIVDKYSWSSHRSSVSLSTKLSVNSLALRTAFGPVCTPSSTHNFTNEPTICALPAPLTSAAAQKFGSGSKRLSPPIRLHSAPLAGHHEFKSSCTKPLPKKSPTNLKSLSCVMRLALFELEFASVPIHALLW